MIVCSCSNYYQVVGYTLTVLCPQKEGDPMQLMPEVVFRAALA
jgi:hypothetical protein